MRGGSEKGDKPLNKLINFGNKHRGGHGFFEGAENGWPPANGNIRRGHFVGLRVTGQLHIEPHHKEKNPSILSRELIQYRREIQPLIHLPLRHIFVIDIIRHNWLGELSKPLLQNRSDIKTIKPFQIHRGAIWCPAIKLGLHLHQILGFPSNSKNPLQPLGSFLPQSFHSLLNNVGDFRSIVIHHLRHLPPKTHSIDFHPRLKVLYPYRGVGFEVQNQFKFGIFARLDHQL